MTRRGPTYQGTRPAREGVSRHSPRANFPRHRSDNRAVPSSLLAATDDPIAAIATAPGRGAVGIVRVSGADLTLLIEALVARPLAPRVASHGPFRDAHGQAIDMGLALHFPARVQS